MLKYDKTRGNYRTVYRTLQYSGRPKMSNLRSWFDISSKAVSNYPEGVIFEWVCINIPWWMYSRVQHTLFCHLCHCELIPRSLSDSVSKIILCPLTIFTFISFHLHDFPSYLCSSLSLSVFYLFIAFSSQLLSLLRFARAAVTRASFLSFPGFPLHIYLAFFLHLSPQFLSVASLLSQSFSVLY